MKMKSPTSFASTADGAKDTLSWDFSASLLPPTLTKMTTQMILGEALGDDDGAALGEALGNVLLSSSLRLQRALYFFHHPMMTTTKTETLHHRQHP